VGDGRPVHADRRRPAATAPGGRPCAAEHYLRRHYRGRPRAGGAADRAGRACHRHRGGRGHLRGPRAELRLGRAAHPVRPGQRARLGPPGRARAIGLERHPGQPDAARPAPADFRFLPAVRPRRSGAGAPLGLSLACFAAGGIIYAPYTALSMAVFQEASPAPWRRSSPPGLC
jgi:hypothetical protein